MARPKGQPKLGGRRKGTPNKLTATVKEAIEIAFHEVGGVSYLVEMAREEPKAFLTLLAKVIPQQLATVSAAPEDVTKALVDRLRA